ncbi:unnamed protein product [Penicillium nalgiovense]|nr:unnamed protein product [Penicillium nalgiovense]
MNETTSIQFLGQRKLSSVADCIGATPLVRLNRVPASLGIKAEVYAKLEYLNPGGSVKDRIAKQMVDKAEQEGKIKPGDTLIEASQWQHVGLKINIHLAFMTERVRVNIMASQHSGIAIALIAGIKGYKCIITLSEKIFLEKEQILHALGAQVVRTPAGVPSESPESFINVARRLQTEIQDSYILNQYSNPENPAAHQFGTAEELWYQTGGNLDVLVSGAGTGGTITGTSRGLKNHSPHIFVVGVDPIGSVLAQPGSLNQLNNEYNVEGIGGDFVPDVLDQAEPDLWIKTSDRDCFRFVRRLVREEGLLCGGSAGATIAALVQLPEQHPELDVEGKTIVVILPDGLRNYLTKFANDTWMEWQGYASV